MKLTHPNRVYNNSSLQENNFLNIENEDFHYLSNVLRVKVGSIIKIFNENDGEFIAEITKILKNKLTIHIQKQFRYAPRKNHNSEITLAIAIIKPVNFLIAIDMAVQIGVDKIQPIVTERCQIHTINIEKTRKRIIEATEQSNRLSPPILLDVIILENIVTIIESDDVHTMSSKKVRSDELAHLKIFDYKDSIVLYANEHEDVNKTLKKIKLIPAKIILLIGPEGGFSPNELKWLAKQNNFYSISLGENILRSETAAIVGLSKIAYLRE